MHPGPLLPPSDPLSAAERVAELFRLFAGGHRTSEEIKETDRTFEREHRMIDVEQTDPFGTRAHLHAEETVTRVSLRHTSEPSAEHEHRIPDRSQSK